MNILHLNTYDTSGGAARAAYRIHRALRASGVSSKMLVAHKDSKDPDVSVFPVARQLKKLRLSRKLLSWQSSANPAYHTCNFFPSGIHKVINRSDADIVHFHWIANELISIAEVKKIKKPIVWTLHDMWAFSGTEHYDDLVNPDRYKQSYNKLNQPHTHTGRIDVDAWVWRCKRRNWRSVDFNFVTPSRWLAKCLAASALFSGKKASVIPNCIDTDIFQPMEKKACRELFKLPQDKQLILFGADAGRYNPLKGYHLLEKALGTVVLENSEKSIECIVFGDKAGRKGGNNGIPVIGVGWVYDDRELAKLYNAADVFILSSMMDNLPNTIMEAMSCGTPCIGFNIGGMPDMIDHQKTGYLADSFDTADLAQGIRWVLEDTRCKARLGYQAREKVLANYSQSLVARQYLEFYEGILKK